MGQLVRVDEPDGSNSLGTTASPAQATSCAYDALGNLTGVTQGSQTRSFAYSSLARLTSAANPESGMITYTYDNNGNLATKSDARSITTTYSYDELNRVLSRIYSDGTTPTVTYAYDPNVANGKGRLSSVSSIVSAYSYSSYDAMGRVLSGSQAIGNQTYPLSYEYSLAGQVKIVHYPSGHIVTNTYDSAGRLQSLTGKLGDDTLRTYTSGIVYDAAGRMTQAQFGTTIPIYNKLFYNSRGQLAEIREGMTPNDTSWQRGAIINFYAGCWGMCNHNGVSQPMPDNNGNLKTQQVFIPQFDTTDYDQHYDMFSQSYDYDSLNRLHSATEGSWHQDYDYDRWGNRTINQSTTNGIPKPYFGVDPSTNRLTVPTGYSGTMHYDGAGNLDIDTYSAAAVTRLYDAENRMTKETQASSYEAGIYSYDGEGHRVKRKVGGVETWQVYGLGGELLAEYAQNGSYTSPEKEFGYRNGQLLITATAGAGWGSAPVLDDNPLNPHYSGETTVQARHITQLRTAINALRVRLGMSAFPWQAHATTSDWITADPVLEMRTALDQALGAPPSGYSAGLAQNQPIKKVHIQELRDRLTTAWGIDIRWLVSDQLGTPRMVFDQSGSLSGVSRHDYLPFGEELYTGTGGRTAMEGYSVGDGERQKFTQKERDS